MKYYQVTGATSQTGSLFKSFASSPAHSTSVNRLKSLLKKKPVSVSVSVPAPVSASVSVPVSTPVSAPISATSTAPVTPLFPPGLSPPQYLSTDEKPLDFNYVAGDRVLSIRSIMPQVPRFPPYKFQDTPIYEFDVGFPMRSHQKEVPVIIVSPPSPIILPQTVVITADLPAEKSVIDCTVEKSKEPETTSVVEVTQNDKVDVESTTNKKSPAEPECLVKVENCDIEKLEEFEAFTGVLATHTVTLSEDVTITEITPVEPECLAKVENCVIEKLEEFEAFTGVLATHTVTLPEDFTIIEITPAEPECLAKVEDKSESIAVNCTLENCGKAGIATAPIDADKDEIITSTILNTQTSAEKPLAIVECCTEKSAVDSGTSERFDKSEVDIEAEETEIVKQGVPEEIESSLTDEVKEEMEAVIIDTEDVAPPEVSTVPSKVVPKCLAESGDFTIWLTKMSPQQSNVRDTHITGTNMIAASPIISFQESSFVKATTITTARKVEADHNSVAEIAITQRVPMIPKSTSTTSTNSSGSASTSRKLATPCDFEAYLRATKVCAAKSIAPGTGVFLKTLDTTIELPSKYMECINANCQYLKQQNKCHGSHHKCSSNATPSVLSICASFVKFGVCPKIGKGCKHGAHPCPTLSRFNKCEKVGCAYLHEVTIDQYGQSFHIPAEISKMPLINNFEVFSSTTSVQRKFDLEPPGMGTKLGPRSNNDWHNYTKFSILPTMDEIIPGRPTIYMPLKKAMFPLSKVLDVGFRHQREAVLGPVRDCVADVIRKIANGIHPLSSGAESSEHAYRVYNDSRIVHGSIGGGRHPVATFSVTFPSPGNAFLKTETILRQGHLLAILISSDNEFSVIWAKAVGNWTDKDDRGKISTIGQLDISLINEDRSVGDLKTILQLQSNNSPFWLVDFGGVLPDTFMNVLSVLQQMSSNNLPFAQDLFENRPGKSMFHIPGYLRDQTVDFSSLGHHLVNRMGNLTASTKWRTSMRSNLAKENFEGVTFTDGQLDAIMNTICSALSCIQGPPGTGKSFIGKAIIKLLAVNRRSWSEKKTAPILLTAQTNHALDETIAGYIKCGLKVARLGIAPGRETPQAEHVQYQKHALPREQAEMHRKASGRSYKDREEAANTLRNLLDEASKGSVSWFRVSPYLQKNHPEFFKSFIKASGNGREGDGFNFWASNEDKDEEALLLAGLKKTIPEGLQLDGSPPVAGDSSAAVQSSVVQGSDSNDQDAARETDLWKLTASERSSLISNWKLILNKSLNASIEAARGDLRRCQKAYDNAAADETAAKMMDFGIDVVACTTTRLSRDYQLLKVLGIQVVVVEEAGEVVEPNVLPIFLPSIQQVILIGDHEQLKPFNNHRGLTGGDYNHDQSLFERLVTTSPEGAPPTIRLSRLDCQRRMRPEIADLVRCLGLYDNLSDGENVKRYPDVPGMGGNNLLWIDHRSPENFGQDKSYSNAYEASMLAALTTHLIKSGEFSIRDLVIITPYRAQVAAITSALSVEGSFTMAVSSNDMDLLIERNADYRPPLESVIEEVTMVNVKMTDIVLVTTVDNYQGQEANVIFYSAVRSNTKGRIGFTDVSNRICVTLSRARHGMYIIGNAETARASGKWWSKAANHMRQRGLISGGVPLQLCSRHPGETRLISNPAELKRFRDSESCKMTCGTTLTCGHICQRQCHPEAMHKLPHFKCAIACDHTLECGHKCVGKCGAPSHKCGECREPIEKSSSNIMPEAEKKRPSFEMCQHKVPKAECITCCTQEAISNHEDWYQDFSCLYTARARSLKEAKDGNTPAREIFLKSLNLSRAGLGDNTYKFGMRMSIFRGFDASFKGGLKGAEELEEKFGCSGEVERVEEIKAMVKQAVADDYDWLHSRLVKLSTPGNSAKLFAGALKGAVDGVFK